MDQSAVVARTLEDLESRIQTMLPPMYQETYRDVVPISMGSAALQYAADGRVAWDQMWASFCDLAMAGGPPHRGTLLEPAGVAEVQQRQLEHEIAAVEICRGISLVTGLHAYPSSTQGWVSVDCTSAAMAAWLVRAITMENVAARAQSLVLSLPAGPAFRVEKEIKNVITSFAKTAHFWSDHMSWEQQDAVGLLLRSMERETPLIQPEYDTGHQSEHAASSLVQHLQAKGLHGTPACTGRWVGMECVNTAVAISTMRLLVVSNVLSRREGTTVLLAVNGSVDPTGEKTAQLAAQAFRYAGVPVTSHVEE